MGLNNISTADTYTSCVGRPMLSKTFTMISYDTNDLLGNLTW